MNRQAKNILKYALSIFLTLFFLYFAYKGTDFPKLWAILATANYWWAFALLPPLLISHVFRAWRWEYLLRPVKKEIRFRNLWSALCVGYMVNNILPKVGEIVRPYAIGKLEGISKSAAFGTLLVERIFDMISFLIMVGFLPLLYSGPLSQTFPWLEEIGIWVAACTLLAISLCTFFMMRRDVVVHLLNYVTRHLSERRARFVERATHSFLDGFLFLKEPRHYFVIGVLSIFIWGLYIIMMYVPFYAFGLTEKYGLDMKAAAVVQTISSLGYMAPTPGATGPYHYFTMQTLTKLYGVDDELARSYATITHAVGFLGITLIGIYYFWIDKLHIAELTGGEEVSEQVAITLE
ncbi:MAG: flippase-like domain-containing protein [Ignavibacteriae bacterium]|nr:flippase-like domain-containing protein [Ignavibacteria bacterium]MBI3365249.1 flippase-like domain-containing protein [Ignavibacteriota bacterium]